jgi:cytochrome b involved in lipid metabolism
VVRHIWGSKPARCFIQLSPQYRTAAMLSWEEVSKHDSRDSCWVVIRGFVYDVTTFLDSHPGGANPILRYGGKDGTEEYESLHPLGTLEKTLSAGMIYLRVACPFAEIRRPKFGPSGSWYKYSNGNCEASAGQ